jgi:PmbA protein
VTVIDELYAIADRLVDRARPGEQVEVVVAHSKDTEVRVYEGEIESLSVAESQGVGVRVVADQRQGFASAGTFDPAALDDMLDEARDNARYAEPDEYLGLAEPDGVAAADLDLWADDLATTPTEAKIDLATALEKAVRAGDERIIGLETAEYADAMGASVVVSSTGVRSGGQETVCDLVAYALASDGTETQTGFGFSVGRSPDELDVDEAARDAVHRATRLLGASKPPSQRLTVVLDPFVTAQFLAIVGSTLSGDAVLKGRSPFGDRVGEAIAAPQVTFVDDPTDARAFTAGIHDGEGLATRRNVLVDGGTLTGFVHDAYSGRRSGAASTGSAVRSSRSTPVAGCQAISLVPGDRSPDALLAEVGDGLLVSDVSGLHSGVNPVSGDFSTGADGLRITGGGLGEPVREFTIASTLQRMLQDVVAVGDDLTWLPMSAAGLTLVIADVSVSGV